MINALYGEITSITSNNVIIKSGSIEFNLLVATSTASKLSQLMDKNDVRIVTYLQHREDAMTLFGFVDELERILFTITKCFWDRGKRCIKNYERGKF